MNKWKVYCGNKLIDTCFFHESMEKTSVKHSLILSGFPEGITVKCSGYSNSKRKK